MNWDAISFDWNQVRAVLASVEEGSFSGAARALRTTQPTIGRQVRGLEDSLGIVVFERTVRGPVLTEAGQRLVDHIRAMADAATLVSMAADRTRELSGEVTITCTDLMASAILPPLVLELQQSAPGIRIKIVAASELKDIGQREADIAIRHVRPDQPAMIARHIMDFRASCYAARCYLDRAGRPRNRADLAGHRFIGGVDLDHLVATLSAQGVPVRRENIVAATNSGPAMWELVKAGLGVALLPEVLGDGEPGLEKVLESLASLTFPVWLVTHRELRTNPKIRFVFDALVKGLGSHRALKSASREI